jgi:ZIP family zinc transporter
VLHAAVVGFVAAASLILGAAGAFTGRFGTRAVGLIMGFGGGVLMSAVAYELVAEALHDKPWIPLYGAAFAAGAVTFFTGSVLLDRRTARSGSRVAPDGGPDPRAEGAAIVLGAVLDGIPESIVLGVSLLGDAAVSVPMLLAVFISNVPEALGASTDLERGGMTRGAILRLWFVVALVSGAAAAIGYTVLADAAERTISSVQMFAGGAIIAMLAESMVPEAYESGGRAVGLATALGFALAAILSAAT